MTLCSRRTPGKTRDEYTYRTPQLVSTDENDHRSNPSLCKVILEIAILKGAVGFAPVISVECLSDRCVDSVVIDHSVIATRAGLELEFVVGREIGKVFDLQTVSIAHLRVCGLLVAAVAGSSATENTRVGISR